MSAQRGRAATLWWMAIVHTLDADHAPQSGQPVAQIGRLADGQEGVAGQPQVGTPRCQGTEAGKVRQTAVVPNDDGAGTDARESRPVRSTSRVLERMTSVSLRRGSHPAWALSIEAGKRRMVT